MQFLCSKDHSDISYENIHEIETQSQNYEPNSRHDIK